MEPESGMKEMMQAMMAMSAENPMIKAEPFSGKQKDFPKWQLKQKQHFIAANMGHILEKGFLAKFPTSKTMEFDESIPDHKQFAKYRRHHVKAGAVLLAAQESEDVILAIQESNTLLLTWPSDTALDMWQALEDIFQVDDGLSETQMEEDLHALKFTKKEEPQKLALKMAKISMEYKKKLTDQQKAAHIMKLGKAHYADVLFAKKKGLLQANLEVVH